MMQRKSTKGTKLANGGKCFNAFRTVSQEAAQCYLPFSFFKGRTRETKGNTIKGLRVM